MFEFLVGLQSMGLLWFVRDYTRRRGIRLTPPQWALTLGCIAYTAFTQGLCLGFLREGAHRAAVVMAVSMGVPAVIWAVLLVRQVFLPAMRRSAGGDA